MMRTVRVLISASILAVAAIGSTLVSAASITLSDPNCDSFSLTGTSGNQTLTCVVSTPPSCTVAGPTVASIGTPITLTAQCSPAATSWVWTGGSCGGVTTSQCSANDTANPTAYTVQGSNATGTGSVSSPLNVSWIVGAPPAPSNCTITFTAGSASLPSTGGAITMVAGCTTNAANATYAWTKNGLAFVSGTTLSDTLAANTGASTLTTTYAVSATNAGAAPTITTQPVTVAGSAGGGGGNFDLSGCAAAGYVGRGLDVTYPLTVNTSIPNGAASATPGGTFGNNDALVIRFTTPAVGSPANDSFFQPAGNPPSQNTSRLYTLATAPCQFATSSAATGPIVNALVGQSPAFNIHTTACPTPTVPAACAANGVYLIPNTTYYITMVNRNGFGASASKSCAFSSCDMRIDFNNK